MERTAKVELWRPERFLLTLVLAIVAIDLALVAVRGANIDWPAYTGITIFASVVFSIGQFYRVSGRSARIGAALTCTGIFMALTTFMVLFNYLLLPNYRPKIDITLAWIDSFYGYHWPDYVAWWAQYPLASLALKIAYISTMLQVALIVIVLGLTGRIRDLHSMLIIVLVTSIVVICLWALAPSVGPIALYTLTDAARQAVNPILDHSYAEFWTGMMANGPGFISPNDTRGLIGFPSYHAVMAFCAAYAARNVRWLFPIYLLAAIMVVPATPLHGGHHVIDVIGGFVIFVAVAVIVERMVRKMYEEVGQAPVLDREQTKAGSQTA